MKAHSMTPVLLTALLIGATALVTVPAPPAAAADIRVVSRAPAPPAVTFRLSPAWQTIPGTTVAVVRAQDRPDYDLFRYGSRYFLYKDGYWYRSSQLNQRYVAIDERYVPMAIAMVPHDHWRSYPPGWMNPRNPHYSGRHDNRKMSAKAGGGKMR